MFRRLAATVALLAASGLAQATATPFYSNFNGDHVNHGGTPFATFTLASAVTVGVVDIYVQSATSSFTNDGWLHFANIADGTSADVAVSVNGTWHQYGPTDFDQLLSSSVAFSLTAGTYKVTADSAVAAEWAYNAASGNQGFIQLTAAPEGVPEPASVALVGAALLGLGLARRRQA